MGSKDDMGLGVKGVVGWGLRMLGFRVGFLDTI